MKLALICERCGNISTSDTNDEGMLAIDFRQKQITYICQNKQCKHDNIFQMDSWVDTTKKSPLPKIRVSR